VAGIWAGLAWNGDGSVPLLVSGVIGLSIAGWLLIRGDGRPATTTRSAKAPKAPNTRS
jgi:hypothetical protein